MTLNLYQGHINRAKCQIVAKNGLSVSHPLEWFAKINQIVYAII